MVATGLPGDGGCSSSLPGMRSAGQPPSSLRWRCRRHKDEAGSSTLPLAAGAMGNRRGQRMGQRYIRMKGDKATWSK
jgi:hypothetical protein